MDLSKIINAINAAASVSDKAVRVAALIDAGMELATVVRANVEEATATMSEADADVLRSRAEQLALTNRALGEQLDALLKG